MQELEAWDDAIAPDHTETRRLFAGRIKASTVPYWQVAFWYAPADMPRAKLRDVVPYSAKVLAKKTRPMLSLSREYHEGVKNPLHAETGRNWFGMSPTERKYLLAFERRTGYFSNEVNP